MKIAQVLISDRKCSKCHEIKGLSEFYISRTRKDGYQTRCKECDKEKRKLAYHSDKEHNKLIAKQWRDNNSNRKKSHLKNRYNLSIEEYDRLRKIQNFRCKICSIHEDDTSRGLYVDHDHATLKIRGLLCHTCNWVLGAFNDKTHVFQSAIKYLEEYA